jgi:hypothetical protein
MEALHKCTWVLSQGLHAIIKLFSHMAAHLKPP